MKRLVQRSRSAAVKATNEVYFLYVSNPGYLQDKGVYHEEIRSETIYEAAQRHLNLLKLQGKSDSTISAYSRAVRRIRNHYDCCPDRLTKDQLENYFGDLIKTHSWSTVKIDRLGLMFFWKNVLEQDGQWLDMVKPPQVKSIPDILSPSEIERLICATKKMRYRVFLLATYSMGLRLTETLSLQVGDIDSERQLIHIRRGKGHKDRMVPLPDKTLAALRMLWSKHRHPKLLFPNAKGSMKTIQKATTHLAPLMTWSTPSILL
ncbi:MAG: tyrosine-type recombinase/integrase [Desulforhopalus sp.]